MLVRASWWLDHVTESAVQRKVGSWPQYCPCPQWTSSPSCSNLSQKWLGELRCRKWPQWQLQGLARGTRPVEASSVRRDIKYACRCHCWRPWLAQIFLSSHFPAETDQSRGCSETTILFFLSLEVKQAPASHEKKKKIQITKNREVAILDNIHLFLDFWVDSSQL